MAGGHDGNTQVDEAALVLYAEAAVLRDAAFGDVQIAEDLDARQNRRMPFLGDGLHGVLQHAVNAVLDGDFCVARFDVDVARTPLQRGEDNRFDEAHNRADRVLSRVRRSPEMVSSLSSSSLETWRVKASVACSRTRWDCSVRLSRSPIWRAVATLMANFLPQAARAVRR